MTFEEALAAEYGSKPEASTPQSSGQLYAPATSFAEALASQDENKPDVTSFASAFPIGLNRGAANIIGMPIDAINWTLKQSHEYLGTPAPSEAPFGGSESIKKGMGLIGANPDAPEHKPRSMTEHVMQTFGEGAAGALMPAFAAEAIPEQLATQYPRLVEGAKTIFGKPTATTAIVGGTGALGGEAASSLVPDKWKGMAGMVGGLAGGAAGALGTTAAKTLPVIARAHFAPEELSARVAGQGLREAAGAPKIETAIAEPTLQGLDLASAQASQNRGIEALGRSLETNKGLAPAEDVKAQIGAQSAKNQKVVSTAAENAARELGQDVKGGYSLPLTDAKASASVRARLILDDLEGAADQNVKKLWENPDLKKATMYKNKSIDPVNEFVSDLSISRRKQLDPSILNTIDEISALQTRDVPLKELQDLRSTALAKGRAAYRSGDDAVGGVHYALADKLKNVIGDGQNIVFGDKSGASRQAWSDAVAATAKYHKTFNEGFMKSLNQNADATTRKVAIDDTFKRMLAGGNANQNIAQFQNATKGAINDHLADYLVGELTHDGVKIVSPKDVDNWMAKRGSTASLVPGLRDRIQGIRDMSLSQKVSEGLSAVTQDPDKLSAFMSKNKADIATVTQNNPQLQSYMEMLENSANRIKLIDPDKATNLTTVKKLANGNVSDILYGIGTGKIIRTAASDLLIRSIGEKMGVDLGASLEAVGALAGGVGSQHLPFIGKGVEGATEWALTGNVRQKAIELLHQARTDPELMKILMAKPDPRAVESIFSEQNRANVVRGSMAGREAGNEHRKEPVPLTIHGPSNRFAGGRVGRAAGGKVGGGQKHLVDRLMGLAEQAKKSTDNSTKPLLNAPDEAIVKALRVANQAI